MKKLWHNCHVATMQNGRYSIIENAAIVTLGNIIHWIGMDAMMVQQSAIGVFFK